MKQNLSVAFFGILLLSLVSVIAITEGSESYDSYCENIVTYCEDNSMNKTEFSTYFNNALKIFPYGSNCSVKDDLIWCGGLDVNQDGILNETDNETALYCADYFLMDTNYPIFSNYYDNNGTLNNSGIAEFRVNVENTNGTVILTINTLDSDFVTIMSRNNYSANIISGNEYNFSIELVSGNYSYFWYAYGNGSDNLVNNSENRSYIVNYVAPIVEEDSSSGGSSSSRCTYNENFDWGCSEWSVCLNGEQTRTCNSLNNCGNTYGKPETTQGCELEIQENEQPKNQTIQSQETPISPAGITANVIGGLTSTTGLVIIAFLVLVTGSFFTVRFLRKRKAN